MAKIKKKIIFFLATRLGWLLIWFFGKLTRITVINQHYWDELVDRKTGFLVLLWHGRIVLPIFHHRWQGVVAMVSQHDDGEMIAQTVEKLGFTTVRGSSTRGGRQALMAIVRELKKGKIATMMPDGPRGPRHEFKPGAIYIAQLAHVPILPMTFSANLFFEFRSWDRFMLMKPFSRSIIMYGEPYHVPARLEPSQLETVRAELEIRLNELEDAADAYFRK
ncbi:lysophospholipid acyltransferase family protein [candidate division KSB1 bacterium]|nr:lysophospholipid acyltransferase family protein [candidate division KSB1 bacterium]